MICIKMVLPSAYKNNELPQNKQQILSSLVYKNLSYQGQFYYLNNNCSFITVSQHTLKLSDILGKNTETTDLQELPGP